MLTIPAGRAACRPLQVIPPLHHGKPALVALERQGKVPFFMFQKFKYIYERNEETGDAPAFRAVECPDQRPLHEYTSAGLSNHQARGLLKRHGPNQFRIEMPTFQSLCVVWHPWSGGRISLHVAGGGLRCVRVAHRALAWSLPPPSFPFPPKTHQPGKHSSRLLFWPAARLI